MSEQSLQVGTVVEGDSDFLGRFRFKVLRADSRRVYGVKSWVADPAIVGRSGHVSSFYTSMTRRQFAAVSGLPPEVPFVKRNGRSRLSVESY
jgi:hypothetical protein